MQDPTSAPLISILVATYNRADGVCRAIQSVLNQPGDYYELVIVNDASPDNTHDAVQPYLADPRVRYFRNEVNLGMRDNYLKIFRVARGDYVFILTDDDWLIDGKLERVERVIREFPQVGYILSDLPTVDDRTGNVIGIDRAYASDRLLEPSLENMSKLVGFAWVLSRQVLRRDLVDWDTWVKFKENIFFPIIFSGRVLLKAPCYYIADQIVMHTWFNEVFWHKFGRDQLDINFNLAADHHQAMQSILHDYEMTADVRSVIERWELRALKDYLYSENAGFYDLVRAFGIRPALAKLRSGFSLSNRGVLEIGIFFVQIPVRRAWVTSKSLARRYTPTLFSKLKEFKNRLDGSTSAKLG